MRTRRTASGTASSEGLLSLSTNGQYLLLTGYAETLGVDAGSLSGSSVPRVVGRISASGQIDTSTSPSNFATGNNPRSVASPDGVNLWLGGASNGVEYTTFGSTGAATLVGETPVTNIRGLGIFEGQLYASSGSSSIRLATVGTGLPETTGQTITNLPGFETSGSPYQFYFTTLNGGTGPDTVYVSDTSAGVQKFSLVSGSWTANGALSAGSDFLEGIAGVTSGTTVTLFATGSGSGSQGLLVTVVDSSGFNEPINGTLTPLVTAAANMTYRGVALFP